MKRSLPATPAVSFHHGQWWLEDLGSTNGTFLNKNQIAVPTVIITGDQIQMRERNLLDPH